jgi:methionyl-tRNA synthetase
MSSPPRKILVAVAWPYANGPRHIGHVAGFGVPSDVFARYHRLRGNDVLMVSGTDEHGTPIMVAADAAGVSPRELADRYNEVIREDLRRLGLSYDLFTRTTTENHHAVVRDVFRTLYDHGFIVEQTTVGAVSAATGRTLPDRYIEGTCPICGYEAARGDQCDNCGNQLDPTDLINPRSRIDGSTPEFRETKHLFLDLPAFAERLAEWIERAQFLAQLRPRPQAARGHARPRLGRPDPRAWICRGSEQADLRLVRCRDRLPLRRDRMGDGGREAGRLARVVAKRGCQPRLLHGQGQHRVSHRHLAEHPPRLRRRR